MIFALGLFAGSQLPDLIFFSEGKIIRNALDEVKSLSENYNALNADLFSQVKFLLFNIEREIALETWNIYDIGLILTPQAVTFALLSGFLLSLLFYVSIKTFGLIGSKINSRIIKKKGRLKSRPF